MFPDYHALAGLSLVAAVALFAGLVYAETWRTGKQLRRHRALLAGVGHRNRLAPAVASDTWQVRRDLAVGELREGRRLRRLRRASAVMTCMTLLGVTLVFDAVPIQAAPLVGLGR